MERTVVLELIAAETEKAREELFAYDIEAAVKRTVELVQKLTPLAGKIGKEKEMNQIAVSLMTAMEHKDYLLFSDIACYEIPALFGEIAN